MSYTPTVWQDGDHVTAAKLNKLEQGVDSMSYTPTVWSAGDVVTAEKLNKLEQGVANSGGGGGDFSTAEVTVVNDTGSSAFAISIDNCPVTYEEEGFATIACGVTVPKASQITVTVPLFKGCCAWIAYNWACSYTVSGNMEDDEGYILITGDGTITLTGIL